MGGTRFPERDLRGPASAANSARSGAAGRAAIDYGGQRAEGREITVKAEEHTQWVGAIVTNLQALETVLRYFLVRLRKQDPQFPKVGDRDATKTYLTRYLSLGKIIRKYNGALAGGESKFKVDEAVLHIRDAFAHGRLLHPPSCRPACGNSGIPKTAAFQSNSARSLPSTG